MDIEEFYDEYYEEIKDKSKSNKMIQDLYDTLENWLYFESINLTFIFYDFSYYLTVYKFKSLINDYDINELTEDTIRIIIDDIYYTKINNYDINDKRFNNTFISIFNECKKDNLKSFISKVLPENIIQDAYDFIDTLTVENIKCRDFINNILEV